MTPSDHGKMEFVNRFVNDSVKNIGWQENFSLMSRIDNKSHYENLNQRTLIVPVIHVRHDPHLTLESCVDELLFLHRFYLLESPMDIYQ